MPLYGATDHGGPEEQLVGGITVVLSKAERDLLQSHTPGYGSRSIPEVAFNLVNATVGAGIIGLPFAIYHAGLVFGIIVSIFVAIVSQLGLYMLIVAGQRVEIYKFATLVEYVLGRPGYHFLNIMLLVQAAGVSVSYFILMGDTLPVLLALYFPQYTILHDRTTIMILLSTFLVFPLNLSRSIGALARWSIVSVLCLPVIILTILIRAPAYIPKDYHIPLTLFGPEVFSAVGIMAFAFACSHVGFNNYLSQKNQSSRAWCLTTATATVMSWTVSMVFGLVGYLCFGDKVQPNLFLNFAPNDAVINIGRFALGFSMILSIPMGFYPAREAVQKLLHFETAERHPTRIQHYVVTVILFAVLTYIGITVRSLGKVYALIGGFSATSLAYIFPAGAYLATRHIHIDKTVLVSSPKPLIPASNAISATPAIADDDDAPSFISSSPSTSPTPHFPQIETPLVTHADMKRTPSLSSSTATTASFLPESSLLLDVAAGLLIIWGFVVMVFATGGVFT
ncbi:transmembrane amino acid transporter protein-domain-containing protein [Syncephalastrum racemosum]|uniref:Transmembrane amino acid transporter protein-domain-containing protein n=1 Tax=Syncephalastrum racemosum TaxID=13706 RepID=A0A1X2H7S3_SYNRA|nr:transmembrane amino acid transporter protein-domain-containing protein [Syncephalastrum racemosum]